MDFENELEEEVKGLINNKRSGANIGVLVTIVLIGAVVIGGFTFYKSQTKNPDSNLFYSGDRYSDNEDLERYFLKEEHADTLNTRLAEFTPDSDSQSSELIESKNVEEISNLINSKLLKDVKVVINGNEHELQAIEEGPNVLITSTTTLSSGTVSYIVGLLNISKEFSEYTSERIINEVVMGVAGEVFMDSNPGVEVGVVSYKGDRITLYDKGGKNEVAEYKMRVENNILYLKAVK